MAFDFNSVNNSTLSNTLNDIANNTIIENIKQMVTHKITIPYVFKKILGVKFASIGISETTLVSGRSSFISEKYGFEFPICNFKTMASYRLVQVCDELFRIECKWDVVNYFKFKNDPAFQVLINDFLKQLDMHFDEQDFVYISPDKGIIAILPTVSYPFKSVYIMYTGMVYYEKNKRKKAEDKKQDPQNIFKWFKKELKNCNVVISEAQNINVFFDKAGYPQIVGIINERSINWNYIPDILIEKPGYTPTPISDYWQDLKIVKNNGRIIKSRTNLADTITCGLVIPFNINNYRTSEKLLTYRPYVKRYNKVPKDQSTNYHYSPESYGIVAFKLTEKGKELYKQTFEN